MSTAEAVLAGATEERPLPGRAVTGRKVLRVLARDRTGLLGLVIVAVMVLAVALAPLIAPDDPNAIVTEQFASPSRHHPFGADHLGRDMLSRLLFGGRVSIGATIVATGLMALIGLVVGMVAGYFGGAVDMAVGRVIDVLVAFPSLLLTLVITGALGVGLRNVVIGLVVVRWVSPARIVRAAVLGEREKAYVEASRSFGSTDGRILRRHLLPNVLAPFVVHTSVTMGGMLLSLAALSFVGLGVRSPTAEWGSMLAEASAYIGPAPHLMWYPGAAIFLFVLGFNLLGDGLRDVTDPRTRGSH